MEIFVREASNIQYVALLIKEAEERQQGKKRKRKLADDTYTNKVIARSIRVRHARHLPP